MFNRQNPLRVLLVTWSYFPYMGGIPTHVHEISRRFAAAGVAVTVLTTNPGGHLAAEEECEGIRIRRVRAWPATKDFYLAPRLYSFITHGNWDIVHTQGYQTLVPPLAMLAALKAKIPYILTFHPGGHSAWFYKAIKKLQHEMLRPLVVRASRLVITAEWEIEFFSKRMRLPRQRFVLIPNGGSLPQPANPVNRTETGKLIVSIGRLERYKGHHRVIAALPMVLEREPEVRLRIVGAGPYESALWKMARDLGVADRIHIGAVPPNDRNEIASILSRANLVTLLSEFEGHPMSITEALALGRPVLVSDHPGLQEFVDRGLACGVSLKSTPTQVAEAILGQLRRPLIPSRFELPTWDDCATNLLNLYYEVVRESPFAF